MTPPVIPGPAPCAGMVAEIDHMIARLEASRHDLDDAARVLRTQRERIRVCQERCWLQNPNAKGPTT